MEWSHSLCVVCGAKIPYHSPKVSWQRDFRAVRCDRNSGLEGRPFLTGVGGYVPLAIIPDCAAPSAVERRWSDEGLELSAEDAFPPLVGERLRPQPGFLFHEVCWDLLITRLAPRSVPIERLYDILLSCPANRKGWLDWGHNYGGLMDRAPEGYPWEDVSIVGFIKRYLGDKNSPLSLATANPIIVPELKQALVDSQRTDVPTAQASLIVPVFQNAADCFQRLPQEVLELIQVLLPSHSVANARLASRSFASLPFSQTFWASRFDSHQERGFCFEATDPSYSSIAEQRNRDWRILYEKTGLLLMSSLELKNRKRVWDLLEDLADLLEEPLNNDSLIRTLQAFPAKPSKAWRPVGGDFSAQPADRFPCGVKCREIYEQTVSISAPIRAIKISFRRLSEQQYISGIRFIFEDHQEVILGYTVTANERMLDMGAGCYRITGFITAVSPRGIMALRAVTDKGDVSSWVGSWKENPQTLRLCMKETIHEIKGYFDGFKMVSLAVPSNLNPLFPSDSRGEHLPLRTTGLWYPDIPAPSHHLHDGTFSGRQIPLHEYRPLVHIMFGGLKGHMLQYLTRISVTVSKTAIVGIDFFYNDDAPVKCLQACPATATGDYTTRIPFPIDGPAGERLTGIQADTGVFASAQDCSNPYNYGAITSLKVTTNFKPVPFTFQPSAILQLRLPVGPCIRQRSRKAEIAPGMTLTGIYFMHDPKFGMLSMGCISEDLTAIENGLQESLEDEITCRIIG
ncbi:hypothetical protein Asppvi_001249 [Aspergillus pseudoviridinutans]|uniref:DUF7600 domain-containing protein n=1 Tax=Aspergillus pseudoviridinutans TaxID=1517512 RepID=A0A9P3B4Q2_9EURO|nr:uncharacterized protein Asppvi_001249 [Aspergillus pseudoviridinutans]GIJ82738.1 hypothetical protein Asppvi_001249 [Aspergillus pseudoviridinutans]